MIRSRSALVLCSVVALSGRAAAAQAPADSMAGGDSAAGRSGAPLRVEARSVSPTVHDSTGLVDVSALDPSLILDIRYATRRNFTGRTLYPVARCLLRPDVAERLMRVDERLKREGLRLVIFDCYRPLSIQRELWALVPDERYVANPAKGSRHNRAAAVDLTLADSGGAPLPMPTEYDDFTEKAHRDYQGATPDRIANREKLEEAMAAEGFEGLPTEWWHFDAPGWERYPVLDVPLTTSAARR
jgi:D-alanyl-D-alanine dipeptidase